MTSTTIQELASKEYKYGFVTDIEADVVPRGLNEDIIRLISAKKNEPEFMLEWRLKAYRHWLTMQEPRWQNVHYPPIDYQDIIYYAAPKLKQRPKSLDEVDPVLLETYEKLGIPLREQEILAGVAVDAVFDSISVATTFKDKLAELGIIFCAFSEAVQHHPELVQQYLGSVVPYTDNFFAALNSAVFSDGSFVYVPKGVRCPMELSTYFRINAADTGQFERTLIIADEGAYVSYLEGCHPAGEQVWTPTGWVNIERLKPGDVVYDHTGSPQKVRAVMTRHHRGEMITIRPVSRYNQFRLTPEHPVLAIKRAAVVVKRQPRNGWLPEADTQKLLEAEPTWIPAGQLEKGDFVLIPKLRCAGAPAFTNEEVELLGYYLAEGSSYYNEANKQYTNQFSFGLHETTIINRVRTLIKNVTGRPAYLIEQPDRNGAGISFFSEQYSDWFIRHCGKGACSKRLSAELMSLSTRQTRIFLDAYLAGDGNICDRQNSRMIRFCTGSETVAQQIQMLLNRLGTYAWVQVREGGDVKFSNHSDRTIHRQPLYHVGYTDTKKWSMVRETETHFIVPIQEVRREPYDDFVFNIDVDRTHSYLVRGVAVHNCTAPKRDENQLHAAVVELIALDNATIKYSTVQNWYPGDKDGNGGIYNFVTKRGKCLGKNSKISWTQVETGSAITWKYPSCILQGDNSVGEFYSVALTNNYQQADTGTKMIHIGKNTRSTIVSKGISAGHGQNTYRGMVKILKSADNARNYSQCDSLLLGDKCGAHTFPYIEVRNSTAQMEHEASTSKIGEDQIFYCQQRGISAEDAVSMIVNGFCKEVFRELPMEFAVEAQKLLGISLEGSVG
ncbi:MAG: SufD family Fe-S cluster assembly protein [Acidobacteriota bacterium]|nr:SufD family Fe-S cluster assembly protein [Blastocatellia bacterium]MDW8239937.1 SufD family Fe-S cluster assembly protein [Acidobacteriota bacterium]